MAAKVEQNYKEHATSIDRWGRYTSVEVPYIVFDAADEDAALTAVLNTAPKTLHDLPLDAIEIDSREGDTTFKVNATYKAETSTDSYGDEEEDEESTISFDCGAGTKHVSFAIDQRIAYGTIAAGGAIGWNGKHGTEMEIAGVDVPTAELRETHTKTMRVTKLTNDFIRKVAGFVGKVNSKTFNGWHPGEAMFLGMSYSRAKSAKHVSVTFHFSIQLNETNAKLCGHSLGSKKGFEYISAIPKTSVNDDVPSVDIEAAHISQVVHYGDFGELGV